jgi:hypothetical protein
MNKFSEAYEKACDVIENQKYINDWQAFLEKEVKVKQLLDPAGPQVSQAPGLEKLRKKIKDETKKSKTTAADQILAASAGKAGKLEERAATLKLLKHFYLVHKRGAQDVWVYSPPKAYSQWIYDEITPPENSMKPKLDKELGVYSADERRIMGTALQLALAWSLGAVSKLDVTKPRTLRVVRRWFADSNTSDDQIKIAIGKLKEGFKKIANVANSNKLIFSDEPLDRKSGGWKDWAFIYKSETMDVVYLQGAFVKAGNTGKTWMCALTIIHELSHRAVGTDDIAYDSDGLKPPDYPHLF